ncbi:hypothetical protein OJF2_32600 [Aquisphaera giovannonii]|uniref:Uncharacterized protein n=1 Tax=Aquisphaera giovannonii TaxID=406548 RepID=A0A5B9W2D4_9BACT|nr:hypothetical protein [Aquisphaera giovannonii]QEH34718.1 hypothetical protein OJF2_32600 [Aquisphaera giovannonii]
MHIGCNGCGAMAWALLALLAWPMETEAAERVQPVPLGGTLNDQAGDRSYGVYVPTRQGGTLTVKSTGGTVRALTGPDGKPRTSGQDVGGPAAHGWYTFRVSGTEAGRPYSVETTFVQSARSARKPWNYYYWPTKGDSVHEPWAGGNGRVDTPAPAGDDVMIVPYGAAIAPGQDIILPGANGLLETRPAAGDTLTWFPNLYDDMYALGAEVGLYQTPSPLLKYDQIFGLTARSWEAAYSQTLGVQRWPGHCLGGAVASILLNEPTPAKGSGLTRDELKALWAELGENHLNHRIGDYAVNIPAGPPRPGYDPCDQFVARFHAVLERNLRARRIALLGNLRSFPPNGGPDEVWNHGIGAYDARFHAVAGRGERRARIELDLVANTGSNLNDRDPKPRTIRYEYELVYTPEGDVDEAAAHSCDWIGVGGDALYAPLNLLEIAESRWQGHNPMVTEANVRTLDAANGGRGLAGDAPAFRPVAVHEAGRAPLVASPAIGASVQPATGGPPNSPRRALLRIFGRD